MTKGSVIASGAKQSIGVSLDCRFASLLAMTQWERV
jgi:hypothetical protein